MSLIQSNIFPSELLQNTSIIDLNNLDAQNQTSKIIYLNSSGSYELKNPSEIIILPPVNISPGQSRDVLQTVGGATVWSKIVNDNIQDEQVTDSKIQSLSTSKLTGQITNAQLAGSIEESKIVSLPTTKLKGQITNAQLAGSITDDKLVSIDFDKVFDTTAKITNTMIQDAAVTQSKMDYATPARRRYVDNITGTDAAGFGLSADKAYRTLQYAIDQVTVNGFIIHVLQSENIGTLMINGKTQLAIVGASSTVSNSANLELTGHVHIKNSSSIKIVNLQINSSSLANTHTILCESGNNYFARNTFIGASGKGVYIYAASLYNQFQNCDFALYYESASPVATNLTLVFDNCNVTNAISIANPYVLAVDNSVTQSITQSSGSLQLYNSNVQGNLTFSSPFPNILSVIGCRFFDQTFTSKTVTKSNTGLYIFENNVYNAAGSAFSATRIMQQTVANNDLAGGITEDKITSLPFSKITSTIADSQLAANTVSLSKLKNGTSGKWLRYNVSGVLEEVDAPSTVTSFSELSGTLSNSQVAAHELGVDKLQNYPLQPLKFLRTDANGVFEFADQSSTVAFDSITNWPANYPSLNVVFADSTSGLITNYNFSASTAYSYAGDNSYVFYGMRYLNSGAQQQRFYSINDMMGLVTTGTIPFQKLSISNVSGFGTYLPLIIANNFTASKLTPSLLTSISDSGLGCVGYENLSITGSQPTNNQILAYDSSATKLKWVEQTSTSNLTKGQFFVGSDAGSTEQRTIYDKARLLDNSYLSTNTVVPTNLILSTFGASDNMKWVKIDYAMMNSTNNPSTNQILSYNGSNFTWITPTSSGITKEQALDWTYNTYSTGWKLKYTGPNQGQQTVASLANMPTLIPCDSAGNQYVNCEMKFFQGAYDISNTYIYNTATSVYGQICSINDQGVSEQATLAMNDYGFVFITACDSGNYAFFADQDVANYQTGVRLTASGTLVTYSSEVLKENITKTNAVDYITAYNLIKDIDVYKYSY